MPIVRARESVTRTNPWRVTSVSVVVASLDHIVRKLMHALRVHAPTTGFVWICHRDTKATHISVYVRTVSISRDFCIINIDRPTSDENLIEKAI